MKVCAFCSHPSVKFFPANRDGLDVGPVIDICHRCHTLVPMFVIWSTLAQPSSHPNAFKPVHQIRENLPTISEVRARA